MAEFPDLGQYCLICKRIDFLPIKCYLCNDLFCQAHHSYDAHNCPNYSDVTPETPLNSGQSSSILCKCDFCKQSVPDIERVFCAKCHEKFCLTHRFPESHKCGEKYSNPTPAKPNRPAPQSSEKVVAPKVRGPKNETLANRVALMKLKQTSVGLASIPTSERLYYTVSYQKANQLNSRSVYLSQEWSIGKCVDWLASQFGLTNNNSSSTAAKLILCSDDDNCDSFDFSAKLKDLLSNGNLSNGDKLVLKYSETLYKN